MKVRALQDFNLGSMSRDYKQGQTVQVSASVGKELLDAGLAEAAPDEVVADKTDKPAENCKTKPEGGVMTTKGTTPAA